jgi:uncharacterized membrane protein HdeD (DUF308 family)
MKSIFISTNPHLATFSKNWGWFFLWGLTLFILGCAAISAATFTTLLSVIFIGVVILVAGIVITLDSFSFWWRKGSGFFLHFIMGVLYIVAGTLLINTPLLGSIPLTLFLGIFYMLIGISRMMYSALLQTPNWGWNFVSGILSLFLGVLIVAELPSSALFIIGLFVGIDLLFCGLTYIMVALAARSGRGLRF